MEISNEARSIVSYFEVETTGNFTAKDVLAKCDELNVHSKDKEYVFEKLYDEVLSTSSITKFVQDIIKEYSDCFNFYQKGSQKHWNEFITIFEHQMVVHFETYEYYPIVKSGGKYFELEDYVEQKLIAHFS